MDVNGTRFHLLQGSADWARCREQADPTITISDGASLRPRLFQFPGPAPGSDPVQARRGAARDRYGNWYWIDETRKRLAVRPVGSNTLETFWPVPPSNGAAAPPGGFGPAAAPPAAAPGRLGGAAVTEDHYLIVGTVDQPGLLVFDLHAGGPPRHLRWPAGVPFEPFDLAPRPKGGVFVLDRTHRVYWALDRHLGVIDPAGAVPLPPEDFTPADGAPADQRQRVRFPVGLDLAGASPLAAADPVAIEALPDGTVLILDRLPTPRVHRCCLDKHMGTVVLDPTPVLPAGTTLGGLLGADLAFVSGPDGDRLYVPAAGGNQVFAFDVSFPAGGLALAADPTAPFLPMRLHGGKGLVSSEGQAWYDFDGASWVPLVEQRRPRHEREGTFQTPPFDGREPGCVWHRLFFDGCVPLTTRVQVWSRVAEEQKDLERAPWSPEPTPIHRPTGPELPFVPAGDQRGGAGTFELLFQRARGRWLQLRFRLTGDGRSSPRLRALRIWYPRFSYLDQYLPAVYRADPESASFLDRFLANLEGLFTSVEDGMTVARLLFDARTAPAETLDWLAGWFGVALDPAWTEAKRRLFLRHAMDFFRARGTMRGLRTALRLVLDDCPDEGLFDDRGSAAPASVRILEWFRLRQVAPLALGDPGAPSGIRQLSLPPPWTPDQGGAVLLDLYRAALRAAGLTAPVRGFPVFEPGDGTALVWHQFLRDVLSLSSTVDPDATASWHAFLAGRYPKVEALNEAWNTGFASIGDVPLPEGLPADGVALFDWYQFQLGGGRFVPASTRWIPPHGRAVLFDRWRQRASSAGVASAELPVVEPADAAAASLWRAFTSDVLGFVPVSGARQQQEWREFLSRRYRRISALNLAYGTAAASFAALALPAVVPADGAPLLDWYEFHAVALATRLTAHRFTVLLPVPARDAFAVTKHQERRDLARRIVELEKPAHTLFDVKFYWAMFRVGEARLEVDTLLDQGSRAPELMPPAVLGQAFLAESHLAGSPAEREQERPILGTYPLRSRTPLEEKRS
jgi:phage tail-like protein